MRQLSTESVPLFDMFQALFKGVGSVANLKSASLASGVSEADFNGFMQYVLNFYGPSQVYVTPFVSHPAPDRRNGSFPL